jgi:hypothetical protein
MAASTSPSADTLRETLERYEKAGFKGQFSALPNQRVQCLKCQVVHGAGKLKMQAMHRLEGSSDPADESAVVATSCPACNTRGTLVLTFGSEASLEDKLVFAALQDARGQNSRLEPGM